MRGLMVAHTGGLRAADRGEDLMRLLGAERIMSVPVALRVWAAVSALLNRTTFGKALYLIGHREAAAYLASIGTRRVVVFAFTLCGLAAALSGVTLAG